MMAKEFNTVYYEEDGSKTFFHHNGSQYYDPLCDPSIVNLLEC